LCFPSLLTVKNMKGIKLKIMIVDDNAANLKLAGDVLEIEGFDVQRCVDAEHALDSLQQFKPDLILMDLALPGIDGLQLTRKLKADEKTNGIKIVALTASAMKGDKERILSAGCDGYITKPIDTRKFKEQILEYLSK
jgi:CheY-like chemotaxis protein